MSAHLPIDGIQPDCSSLLGRARAAAVAGDDAAARGAYLSVLELDPANVSALIELGSIAAASGYRAAALTAFRQAVALDPVNPIAQTGYANQLATSGAPDRAIAHYRAALSIDPDCAPAHQGLARCLAGSGIEADQHWHAGFSRRPVQPQPYRGQGPGIPLLLLVSARGGNIAIKHWLDDTVFAVTALYADFLSPDAPLPPHALILNAIGDADLCHDALRNAETIAANGMPILNHPAAVRATSRTGIAHRFADHPDIITPRMMRLPRTDLAQAEGLAYPLLLRSPGFHTGQHFVRVTDADTLATAAQTLPGSHLLAMSFLDARGADGRTRKYRVMFIDGQTYPLHLAIADDWKVHYFSAAMADEPAARAEEHRFLHDMPATIGQRAMRALAHIQAELNLDYAGVDFGLAPNGSLLLFEANATMVLIRPDPAVIWDYRRPAIDAAFQAARRMIRRKAAA